MICIIINDLSKYTNFNEILDKSREGLWSISLYSDLEENDVDCYAANDFRCACNHWCCPENLYIISNLESGLNILIGCNCVEKTHFIKPEKIKKIKAKREENPKYKKFMEIAERKNEQKYKEEIRQQLENLKLSQEVIKKI